MSQQLLTVSTSPHLLGRTTVRSMHLEIMAALAPALLTGLYYFGMPALFTVLLATAAAVVGEVATVRLAKLPDRTGDLHAALMGLVLGLVLPPGAPWFVPVVGGLLTVVLGKMIFGGLGNYPMHPVLVAWVALSLSWPEHMNAFHGPIPWGQAGEWKITETPLMQLKNDISTLQSFEMSQLWLGNIPGHIGAVGALPLLVGGLYLIARRLVPWQIPVGVLAGSAAMALFASYVDPNIEQLGLEGVPAHFDVALFHWATGGLMITAFFLATESVSSPVTPWGCLLFGLGVGFMTVIVRCWGGLVDGAFYGVLIMNAATPLLDRIRPRVLGKVVSGA